jgi:RNA polymerase sigma factor (TIGR02999 family)
MLLGYRQKWAAAPTCIDPPHSSLHRLASKRLTPALALVMSDATRSSQATVTQLLGRLHDGDRAALDALLPLVYDELHALARRQRRRWRGDYTLHTTALVHEAYLKLADQERLGAESRAHFFAIASKAMRHLLCNYARDRRRQKRGGDVPKLSLNEARAVSDVGPDLSDEQADTLAALDDALRRLETHDERQGRLVECRFFGGMTIADTAEALGVSPATVKRDWVLAQAWLHRELEGAR